MLNSELLEKLIEFRKARDWEKFHTFKNVAVSICLEAAELLEHVQWTPDPDVPEVAARKREEISAEIADIAIYLMYLIHDLGIDIDQAVRKKLACNELKYPISKARGKSLKYTQFD